jgi:hypothetical protein
LTATVVGGGTLQPVELLNDPQFWTGYMRGQPLSVVDLLANGTIPTRPTALLWWALGRGASVFVAAGPSGAGKTTFASALLTFVPEPARLYTTSGPADPIDVEATGTPTYLLVNELSSHTPNYLHGAAAERAFARLGDGVRVIGALHATSAPEAVEVMHRATNASPDQIGQVTLVVVLSVFRAASEWARRVTDISLITPEPDAVSVDSLTTWNEESRTLAANDEATRRIAVWAGVTTVEVEQAVNERQRALESLLTERADQTRIDAVVQSLAP